MISPLIQCGKGTVTHYNRTARGRIEPVPFVPTSPNVLDDDTMTTKPSRARRNSLDDVGGLLSDISFVLDGQYGDIGIGLDPMADSDI